MSPIQYHFSNGLNAIFEIPSDTARKILPKGIEPIEANHGVSLIGITLFDFTESPVGPYQELVISLYAVPRMGIMERHPHAAVLPLVVASTHQIARDHAIDLWHLPHFNEDIHIRFRESENGLRMTATVYCHLGIPILELSTTQNGPWNPVYQLYQSFQNDETGSYIGIMDMNGHLCEHEAGTGSLTLYEHRLFDLVDLRALDPLPMREMWMKNGVESYHDLVAFDHVSGKTRVASFI